MILTIIVIIFQVFFSVKNDYKIFKIKPTTDIDVRRGFQSEMLDFSNNNNKYNEISISNKKKENFVQQKLEPEDPNEINAGSNFYSSKFLVPGDVIVVQDDLVMPCDGIILDGSCTVDESDLNGESRKKTESKGSGKLTPIEDKIKKDISDNPLTPANPNKDNITEMDDVDISNGLEKLSFSSALT